MSKISNNPRGGKPFQWITLAGKLNKGAKSKSEGNSRVRKPFNRNDSSSSSSSSDQETKTRVSARQKQLLKGTRIPGERYSVDKCKLKDSSGSKRWLNSARQTELIRSGSNSSVASAEKEQPSSALYKLWPSTAHQRKLKELSRTEWSGSAGSREYHSDCARNSAGSLRSLRKSESRADLLVEAVRFGRKRQIKLLLDGGSDPNITDHEGVTPLIAAVVDVSDKALCQRLMQLLLDAGADPNVGDCNKTTPLMHAATNNCYESAVKLLQHEKTDPGLQNSDGFSALMFAASKGFTNIALLILASFKKVHQVTNLGQRNCEGLTALDLATHNGHLDVANLLGSEVPLAYPKGFSGFIATTHHLSRTPTPTDSFDTSDEDSDDEVYSVAPDKSFRPSTPLDLDSLETLSLNSNNNTRNLDFLNRRGDSSGSGSASTGNEADTESLMDGDQSLDTDSDIEEQSKPGAMSSPAIKSHPSSAGISSPRILPLSSSDRNSQQPMKILSASGNLLVDRNALDKFNKDINNSFLSSGPLRKDASHALNPLVKITLPSPIKGKQMMSNDGMPKLDAYGANKTLNKAIKSLIQDDFDIRPAHRPPTPARPSLPTLSGGKHDSSPEGSICCPTDALIKNRRVTLAGFPRSTSDSKPVPISHSQKTSQEDDLTSEVLNTSTKSEGWDSMWGHRGGRCSTVFHSEGHVVPLPPIGHTGTGNISELSPQSSVEQKESVLNVAKKTLERLENVLSPSEKMHKRNKNGPRSRTVRQLKTSP